MPRLTAYELEIQENIRKNRELLQSLGIYKPDLTGKKVAPAKKEKEVNKLKRVSNFSQVLYHCIKAQILRPEII